MVWANNLQIDTMAWELLNRNKCQLLLQVMNQNDDKKVALAKEYKAKVEKELTVLCETVLNLLNEYLIPNAKETESQVQWIFHLVLLSACHTTFVIRLQLSRLFGIPCWASDCEQ